MSIQYQILNPKLQSAVEYFLKHIGQLMNEGKIRNDFQVLIVVENNMCNEISNAFNYLFDKPIWNETFPDVKKEDVFWKQVKTSHIDRIINRRGTSDWYYTEGSEGFRKSQDQLVNSAIEQIPSANNFKIWVMDKISFEKLEDSGISFSNVAVIQGD